MTTPDAVEERSSLYSSITFSGAVEEVLIIKILFIESTLMKDLRFSLKIFPSPNN
jgi:hypothetical protein